MNTIDLNQIDIKSENSFFHFSPKKFEKGIENKGLIPLIGANSKGAENVPKVFVSCSDEGVLSIILKLIQRSMWLVDDSIDGKVQGYPHIVDQNSEESIKDCMFYVVREYLRTCNYYYLTDVRKANIHDYLYMTEHERSCIDFINDDIHDSGAQMSKGNSHLINGRSVPTSKIRKIIVDGNKETCALDVVLKMIEINRNNNCSLNVPMIFDTKQIREGLGIIESENFKKVKLYGENQFFTDSNKVVFYIKDGKKNVIGMLEESWLDEFYEYCKQQEKDEKNISMEKEM